MVISFRQERLVGSTNGARHPKPPARIYEKPRNHNPEVVRDLWNGSRGGLPVDWLSRQPLGLIHGVDRNMDSGFMGLYSIQFLQTGGSSGAVRFIKKGVKPFTNGYLVIEPTMRPCNGCVPAGTPGR